MLYFKCDKCGSTEDYYFDIDIYEYDEYDYEKIAKVVCLNCGHEEYLHDVR